MTWRYRLLPLAAVATSTIALSVAGASGVEESSGLPPGVQLEAFVGTLRITQDGAVISNMDITGDVIVEADNVTMKHVRVQAISGDSAYWTVRVLDGADGFTLVESEIDGRGTTHSAINGYGSFLRNEIKGAENGINVTGPSLIQENYIHDLRNTGEPHYDGIQVDGGSDVRIIGNTIINENAQTSAVMLDNYFSGLSNITVENNRLVGGGYVLYVSSQFSGGPVDNATIKIINNQVGGGYYGDFAFTGTNPINHGNVGLAAAVNSDGKGR